MHRGHIMENKCENLRSLTISKLMFGENDKSFCFIIPSYQRGYRWDKKQIVKLLDDLLEFQQAKDSGNATVGEFYCLQPIVVKQLTAEDLAKRMGSNYPYSEDKMYIEVVDGQQRLTTIYIFLKYLQRSSWMFELVYERDNVCGFKRKALLESLTEELDPDILHPSTADEHYIKDAFQTVKGWFKEKERALGMPLLKNYFVLTLTEKTQVIWYELPNDPSTDCYAVFKNINNGKIPLTDAELVKAMLLNRKFFSPNLEDNKTNDKIIQQEQERYARLWDEIQRNLSDEELWSFITGNYPFKLSTRIDYLFMIAVAQQDPNYKSEGLNGNQTDDYGLFSYYEKQLDIRKTIEEKKQYIQEVFDRIRIIYRTIEDWHKNYQYHNYIGYLLTYKGKDGNKKVTKIVEYINAYETMTRREFIQYLKNLIKEDFDDYTLNSLSYDEQKHRKTIEKLLMLFNIMELNTIEQKFDFSIGHSGWSIEHIKAQHSEFAKEADRVTYLDNEYKRIEKIENTFGADYTSLKAEIQAVIGVLTPKTPASEHLFTQIAEKIDKIIDDFDGTEMHTFGNLALLGLVDNAQFNNSPFYEKRQILLTWMADPKKNIPYSTHKAFFKMYSPQEFALNFTSWKKADYKALREKQALLLKDFIRETENETDK